MIFIVICNRREFVLISSLWEVDYQASLQPDKYSKRNPDTKLLSLKPTII